METLGQFLKREREFRGISREQLGRSTRMSQTILAVLEEDLPVPAPQTIYIKSFLKNYANHVGLDPTEILARFQTERAAEPAAAKPLTAAKPQKSAFRPLLVILLVASFIAAAAYLMTK